MIGELVGRRLPDFPGDIMPLLFIDKEALRVAFDDSLSLRPHPLAFGPAATRRVAAVPVEAR